MRRGSLGETEGPTLTTIFDNCATCSWEKLTMLNPQLVAGKHVFFGDHESEDIQTGNRVRIRVGGSKFFMGGLQ